MLTDDIRQALTPVIEACEVLSIPYFIGGSLASSTYGEPRSTRDVDVIADLRLGEVDAFVQHLQHAYYIDAGMIRDAIRNRSSFNLIHMPTAYKIDIFILKKHPYALEELRRVIPIHLEADDVARPLLFSSPEDTILRKLEWYQAGGGTSERQWNDVLGVLGVQGPTLDRVYLRAWAMRLGLESLLSRAFQDAGLDPRDDGEVGPS
jgi:hypothetical protein